jgi:hypothetical protein
MATGTGTINSATPVSALYTAIQGVFNAHSNWTFIETVTISTNDYHVWKNHGTGVTDNNSYGSDFFVCFQVATAGTGSLVVRTFEEWDATGKLMKRPCMEDGSNATNADTSGLATGGVVLSTSSGCLTWAGTLATSPNTSEYYIVASKNVFHLALRRSDTTTTYAVYAGLFESFVASKNVFHLALRRSDTTTTYAVYAGLFESFVNISNEFPLCMGANNTAHTNTTTGIFGTSRHPGRVSQAANANNFQHSLTNLTPIGGDTANVDGFRAKAQASKALLQSTGGGTAASAPSFGRLRGTLYDVGILTAASGVTLGIGDVLDDISGDNHWYFSYGTTNAWVNQAAV